MTDVGCAHEVLTDKETGLIVPVGDSATFTQALQHLVRDAALRERLGQAARISVQAQLKAQQDNYGVAWREALT